LLEFDTSALPEDAALEVAELSLFAEPTLVTLGTSPGHAQDDSPNAFFIERVTEPWSEEDVTWQTQPEATTALRMPQAASTSALQNYERMNVLPLVEAMRTSDEGNRGFVIRLQTEDPYRGLSFASSDHPDTALHPVLELRYRPRIE
jgi:hypothetical protein